MNVLTRYNRKFGNSFGQRNRSGCVGKRVCRTILLLFYSRKLKLRTISQNVDCKQSLYFPSQNVKKLIRRKHSEYLHKIESSFCSNPKTFWSYHKAMLHNRTDQKECSEQIGPSLCALFNHSLNCGRVPIEWKAANITPVHKKESKEVAENFRPISLLSIVSEILERSVCSNLYNHISHLIADEQHGFIRNRSCVTQLLSVFHAIGKNLGQEHPNRYFIFGLRQSIRLC